MPKVFDNDNDQTDENGRYRIETQRKKTMNDDDTVTITKIGEENDAHHTPIFLNFAFESLLQDQSSSLDKPCFHVRPTSSK